MGERKRGDVRRFSVPRCPYLIFYGIDSALDEIIVFTVRHAARQEEH
nr:type II toxin-antitoxin system RelE/ParE family toxin [Methylobacterium frigidaeris]